MRPRRAGRALEATNCRRLRILEYRISCTYSIYSNYGALSGEGGGWVTMLIYGTYSRIAVVAPTPRTSTTGPSQTVSQTRQREKEFRHRE